MEKLPRNKEGFPIFDQVADDCVKQVLPITNGLIVQSLLERAYLLGFNEGQDTQPPRAMG